MRKKRPYERKHAFTAASDKKNQKKINKFADKGVNT
jgi:hypothetical protein